MRGLHRVVVCVVDALPQRGARDDASPAGPRPVVDIVAGFTLLCPYSLEAVSEVRPSPPGCTSRPRVHGRLERPPPDLCSRGSWPSHLAEPGLPCLFITSKT